MLTKPDILFTALQHADTFFPRGTVSFSWGLEGLSQDGIVQSTDDVAAFVKGQLIWRWASTERNILYHAFQGAREHETLVRIDRLQEAMSTVAEQRRGSRTTGRVLLSTHEKLNTPLVAGFRKKVLEGSAFGHLAVVQGIIAAGVAMDISTAMMVSGYGCCTGLLSTAIRLGLLTAIDSQRILTQLGQAIIRAVSEPIADLDRIGGFSPQNDIAMMRHEFQEARLFTN